MVSSRTAFTMIELIFAIVLIGIIVAAVPRMITQNSEGVANTLKQEAIAAAAGEAFRILSFPWDNNSVSDNNVSYVLDTNGSADYNRSGGLPLRKGHVAPLPGEIRLNHRRLFSAVSTPAAATLPGAQSQSLLNAIDAGAYKNSYSVVETSGYITDNGSPFVFSDTTNGGTSTNMKMAAVQVDSGTETNILTLRVYAANIGSVEYYTREF